MQPEYVWGPTREISSNVKSLHGQKWLYLDIGSLLHLLKHFVLHCNNSLIHSRVVAETPTRSSFLSFIPSAQKATLLLEYTSLWIVNLASPEATCPKLPYVRLRIQNTATWNHRLIQGELCSLHYALVRTSKSANLSSSQKMIHFSDHKWSETLFSPLLWHCLLQQSLSPAPMLSCTFLNEK